MYESKQNKEKVSRILPMLTRKQNQQINLIQFVTEDYAKNNAEKYNLDYEKVVLPAIKTYLLKKEIVDKKTRQDIASLSESEYMVYLASLMTEADNRGFKKIIDGIWYRGIGFAHFSYPVFRETGILCGEGLDDQYSWTMGEKSETRWLPGSTNVDICTSGPFSQFKFLNKKFEINEYKNIIGIIVQKKLSDTNPALYMHDHESECGIRGPVQVELAYLVQFDDKQTNLIKFSEREDLPLPSEIFS